jgi:uncharacterized protein with von Willebrand factor type A (vWA) domain
VKRASLLPDIDRAIFAAAFVDSLRKAELPVSIHSGERYAAALAATNPTRRTQLYWVSRVCLVHDARHLDTFDRVFELVFEGGALPTGRNARKSNKHQEPAFPAAEQHRRTARNQQADAGGGVPWSQAPSASPEHDEPAGDNEMVLPELLPAELAEIADQPFDVLSEDELTTIGEWLEQAVIAWPRKPVRRLKRSNGPGRLDRRRTLSAARRTGGDPVQLMWNDHRRRTRRVVMLADVSGSMQTFVRPYMHVLRALATHVDAEAFAFSTTITRITPALRRSDPVDAVAAASELVDDRFSGTKIATSLQTLMSHPSWSTLMRGSVVLIASDGWDTDSAEDMDRRMQRLSRMAHRVIWVNPRAAADGFEPLVGGMAAALPHCDVMLSGHSLRSMREVLLAIGVRD